MAIETDSGAPEPQEFVEAEKIVRDSQHPLHGRWLGGDREILDMVQRGYQAKHGSGKIDTSGAGEKPELSPELQALKEKYESGAREGEQNERPQEGEINPEVQAEAQQAAEELAGEWGDQAAVNLRLAQDEAKRLESQWPGGPAGWHQLAMDAIGRWGQVEIVKFLYERARKRR